MPRGDTLDFEVLGGILHRVRSAPVSRLGVGAADDQSRTCGYSGNIATGRRGREDVKEATLTPASSRTSAVRYSRTAVT